MKPSESDRKLKLGTVTMFSVIFHRFGRREKSPENMVTVPSFLLIAVLVLVVSAASHASAEPVKDAMPVLQASTSEAGFAGLVNLEQIANVDELRDLHYQDPDVFLRVLLPPPAVPFDATRLKSYSIAGRLEGQLLALRATVRLDSEASAIALQKAVEKAAADVHAARKRPKACVEQWANTVKVSLLGNDAIVDMAVSPRFISYAVKKPWRLNFWIVIGFIGQALFAGRFLVQWIASEKQKRSVIPIYFWFFSIGGGLVLLVYAISIRDPVFIIGQATGLFIYTRNLMLLAREKKPTVPAP